MGLWEEKSPLHLHVQLATGPGATENAWGPSGAAPVGIPPSRLPHPLQILLRDGLSLVPLPPSRLPSSVPSLCPRAVTRPRAPSPRVDKDGPARLAPLMTRSVVERWRFLPDMIPSASSQLLETASVHLRLRPRRSRLPGPLGSSGRPRREKEAAAVAQPRTPLTGRRPTGRSFLRRGVASASDRGFGRQPGRPRLLAPRAACARARPRPPLFQLPGGPRAAAAPRPSARPRPPARATP